MSPLSDRNPYTSPAGLQIIDLHPPGLARSSGSIGLGGLTAFLLAAGAGISQGQVVLDGKFGTSGALTGPNYAITAGLGATRGNNLFHSFSQFNLTSGEVANFTGPANIQNILARVTGGSPSSIDGTLRSGIAGANLFFINPSGVIFGPNAAVDVSGSFAASTANYLKLADGAHFVAALDADDSGLTTAPVSSFGFLGSSPASISVQQSILQVPNGKAITLVGGDVSFDASALQAPGGQVRVMSVRSAGEVPIDPTGWTFAQFKTAFPDLGEIQLQNGALLDASGDGPGSVVIRGGRLTVDNSKVQANATAGTATVGVDIGISGAVELTNGGQVNSLSVPGLGAGGNIVVDAGSIHLDGGGLVDANFSPVTQISTSTGDAAGAGGGPAKGGDIILRTGNLTLENSAQISAASFGDGNAGNIDITATSILLDARLTTATQISANTQQIVGGGNAGDITIHTDQITLLNGATLLAATFGSGSAGLIDLEAASVQLLSGAIITAGTFGAGHGGNVHIHAGSMHVDGRDLLTGGPDFLTGVQAITTSTDDPAPGGSIQLDVDTLNLEHQGSIFTTSYGLGVGGNVAIQGRQISLSSGGSVKASGEADGAAGQISITAAKDLSLSGGGSISTSALLSSGGDIHIQAGDSIRLQDSQITSQAGPGGGGNIEVAAPSLIYLANSSLNAQAVGDGGNLTIDPVFFILNNGALVSKSSSANGGNITIQADFFFQTLSLIDASAPFGLPGTVSVSAPEVDLSGSLIGLPAELLGAETQLRPDCGVRLAGKASSFVVLGRGGLPPDPAGFVPSGMAPPHESK